MDTVGLGLTDLWGSTPDVGRMALVVPTLALLAQLAEIVRDRPVLLGREPLTPAQLEGFRLAVGERYRMLCHG